MKVKEIWDMLNDPKNQFVFNGSISIAEVGNRRVYYVIFANGDVLVNDDKDNLIGRDRVSTLLYGSEFENKDFELYSPVCIIKSGYFKVAAPTEHSLKTIIANMCDRVEEDENIIKAIRVGNDDYINSLPSSIVDDSDRMKYLSPKSHIALCGACSYWNGVPMTGFVFHFKSVEVNISFIDGFIEDNKMRKKYHLEVVPYDSTKSPESYVKVKFICDVSVKDVIDAYKDAITAIEYLKYISGGKIEYKDDFIRKFYPIIF